MSIPARITGPQGAPKLTINDGRKTLTFQGLNLVTGRGDYSAEIIPFSEIQPGDVLAVATGGYPLGGGVASLNSERGWVDARGGRVVSRDDERATIYRLMKAQ